MLLRKENLLTRLLKFPIRILYELIFLVSGYNEAELLMFSIAATYENADTTKKNELKEFFYLAFEKDFETIKTFKNTHLT